VPPVVPPSQASDVASGAIRGDDERGGHGLGVGSEPHVTPLEHYAGHSAWRAQGRAGVDRGARQHLVQPIAHRHRHDGALPRGAVAQAGVQQVQLGVRAGTLDDALHVSREHVEGTTDEAPAARLVSGEGMSLEQHHRDTTLGQRERGDRPGGPAPHDGDVEHGKD